MNKLAKITLGLCVLVFTIMSCKSKNTISENTFSEGDNILIVKVDNVSDSLVADNISKLIFNFVEINSINIDKLEKLVTVRSDSVKLPKEKIMAEIIKRGGVVTE